MSPIVGCGAAMKNCRMNVAISFSPSFFVSLAPPNSFHRTSMTRQSAALAFSRRPRQPTVYCRRERILFRHYCRGYDDEAADLSSINVKECLLSKSRKQRQQWHPKRSVRRRSDDAHGKPNLSAFSEPFAMTRSAPPLKMACPTVSNTKLLYRNGTYISHPLWPSSKKSECIVSQNVRNENSVCQPLPVTYTNNAKVIERWLTENVTRCSGNDNNYFIGFDLESVPDTPTIKERARFSGPATIQLSTPTATLVAHLTRHSHSQNSSPASPPIAALLQDESILKVGTGIDDDMLQLYRWSQGTIVAKSRFDLGGVGSSSGPNRNNRVGLKNLARAVLGIEMRKSKWLQTSDWSKFPLTNAQIDYCARDAWAGATLMHRLREQFPDTLGINVVSDLIRRTERCMKEVHSRSQERKRAREKIKGIINQYNNKTYSKSDTNDTLATFPKFVPQIAKDEIDRLSDIVEANAPDRLLLFEADALGLDFSFEHLEVVDHRIRR